MYAETFIKLIEDEYSKVVRQTESLKLQRGFELNEQPKYICDIVQKFRSWLTIAVRCSDLVHHGASMSPEDAVIHAAMASFDTNSGRPLHPSIREALSLFDREQLDAIFGETRRLLLEQKTQTSFEECKYKLCYEHCKFVNTGIVGKENLMDLPGKPVTRFSTSDSSGYNSFYGSL